MATNAKRKRQNQSSKSTAPSNRGASKSAATGQVRIIGGQFRRQFVPFIEAEGLRPSPDRLRETLFNWIQFELHDANVLDLCAGSGVLGFEALSRGAHWVDFIELQPSQARLIEQTAQKLKLSSASFRISVGDALNIIPTLNMSVSMANENSADSSSEVNADALSYHLVYLDPPYDLDLWVPMLKLLIKHKLVNSETLFYLEDKRELSQTLQELSYNYRILKETKVGQIFANLIQIEL